MIVKEMSSINEKVKNYINHDASIKKDLKRGIINQRALARYIKEKKCPEASLDAVISAIRRYPTSEIQKTENEFLKEFKLSMKNDIFDLSLSNNKNVHEKLGSLPELIDFSKGEILRIIVGVQSLKIIGDERNSNEIKNKFSNKNIINLRENLSEITLTFPEKAEEKTGIISTVTTELSLNNINLIEIMSSAPELILVINEKDSLETYRTLQNINK